ncbi:Fe2+-dependent dioxygenase [Erythrobacter sp. GH1-10]|uniref:Fe2+-dependent dioxygenase n=1 Tax=Erythrobacter sp. GH1-10 TaxID=3349334 RepID=UPI00387819E7
MILSIAAISDPDTLADIGRRLETLNWRDGRATAGAQAAKVKRNEQAVMTSEEGRALGNILLPLIADNPVVNAAARPRRFSALTISRTADAGHYGAHVDNALMGSGSARMRTDLSFTLFLGDLADYDGGELSIHHAGVTQEVRGAAGELVLYPSTSVHEVRPVTRGQRIVCVGWIESLIADPARRELLFDLENLRASLRQKETTGPQELLTLDKSIANLLRMWAHP